MRNLILFIGLFLLTTGATAQNKIYRPFPEMRYPEHLVAREACVVSVVYDYAFYADRQRTALFHDKYLLDIGSGISRFYSLYAAKCDSIAYRYRLDRKEEGAPMSNWMREDERANYEDFLIGYPKQGMLTALITVGGGNFEYTEPVPEHNWVLCPSDSLQIIGYTCWKATTVFRGREWTVWYAPELPFSLGPWKLAGLPGLVLKATDDCHLFDFTAEQIRVHPEGERSICLYDQSKAKIRKTTRDAARKLMTHRWKDPVALIGSVRGISVVAATPGKMTKLEAGSIEYAPVPEPEDE